ncbi:MAG: hypothetical protein JWP70_2282 [Leifsonia sp.]|nr:hypothetical protein [Leifsonia sp.]MDQ1588968.1 hypothetical protein [Microbacteriaceae bacterium]HEV7564796.1 hypothetical protein [Microbacteriaceae bacterium]
MNNRKSTSEKSTASTSRRFAIGAASMLTATALVGIGAQGAFAATPDATPSGTGSASATASPSPLGLQTPRLAGLSLAAITSDLGNGVFSGHINGAKAQTLAKKLVGDSALFSLLPSTLQSDVTTLANATVSQRTADVKRIVSTALAGGYGSTIQSLAAQLHDARGRSSVKSIVGDVERTLKDVKGIGAQGAKIAATVTGDTQLLASLPTALQTDLTALSKAPASQQTADVQRILATALYGGYGTTIQTIADQIQSGIVSGQ